jgi:hypothetical protein
MKPSSPTPPDPDGSVYTAAARLIGPAWLIRRPSGADRKAVESLPGETTLGNPDPGATTQENPRRTAEHKDQYVDEEPPPN